MARKLKVFRTPIGFHDAYVAAPSQKAALQAWGADADLFARGVAELVTEPALMEEPLADPGKVIRKIRGTMDEHMAALPANPKRKPTAEAEAPPSTHAKPRPSRAKVAQAEQAIEDAEQRYNEARQDIAKREAALRKERQALEDARDQEREKLERAREDQEARYRDAMDAWRGAGN